MSDKFPAELLALTTQTFDANYLIQISNCNGVLCTVGEPAGPGGDPTEFYVWEGAVEDDGQEPYLIFDVSSHDSVKGAWYEAVNFAYGFAIENLHKQYFESTVD